MTPSTYVQNLFTPSTFRSCIDGSGKVSWFAIMICTEHSNIQYSPDYRSSNTSSHLKPQFVYEMEKFIIVKDNTSHVKRFKYAGRRIEFKIQPVPQDANPEKWIHEAIDQVFRYSTLHTKPTDYVGINFCSKAFRKGNGWLSFRKASEVSTDHLWDLICKIYQSNGEAFDTETFCIGITTVSPPTGKGRSRHYTTFEEECSKRSGIISIRNNDNICLPRALAVAIAYAIKSPFMKQIRQNIRKLQDIEAHKLMLDANVSIPEEGAGIEQLQQFQKYLTGFDITVFAYGSKGRDVIFKGDNTGAKHKIYLIHHDNHFNVVTSLTSAFCCSYYCPSCFNPYSDKRNHKCTRTCPCCKQTPACEREDQILCVDCNIQFRSGTCFNKHKLKAKNGLSLCEERKRCMKCLKTTATNRDHVCGEKFCNVCQEFKLSDHHCFIRPDTGEPKTDGVLFIFYDLETRQETPIEGTSSTLHEPNLCVFQYKCSKCLDRETCDFCYGEAKVLVNDPIQRFMEFLLGIRRAYKQVIVVAHNGQAFDHHFLLKYILEHTDLKPNMIMRGSKIILMELQNVRFIDSLNYFPMALSELPKAFDLEPELKKGYFPHLFNTNENANYIGSLPNAEFYDPDNMMADRRTKFLQWYDDHKNDVFDMQKELVDYCKSDVNILAKACLNFRKMFVEETNVCPFSEATTIASACNKVYRRNFLKPYTIGIVPRGGYRNQDMQSKTAIQWLLWEERQRGINILHAAKQREERIGNYKVDGYCKETRQIFEFHGCYYHGHSCLKVDRDKRLHEDSEDTLNLRYERTVDKTNRLREMGYEVIEMWSCDFIRMMTKEKDIKAYTENHPLLAYTPLDSRDAFYGGRTGNTRTYYKCKPGEKIKYVDVCSLYPWVCKYGKFPVGHPTVYVGDDCKKLDLSQTDGLIKCRILPSNLYHPILAMKSNSRLMFGLCRTCIGSNNQDECTHSDDERALTGTWVLDEVRKAIEKGYKILEIYEVWSYDTTQYNKAENIEGLFTSMMNKFFKMKQQASGWPGNCSTEEQKQAYIEEFLQREDIQLENAKIHKNEGLRQFAKLMLNSFWGKFGQRENQSKTCIIDEPYELFELLTNPSIEVQGLQEINERKMVVTWCYKDEAADLLCFGSVPIASYVTTQARLKLYSYLEKLGERVIYYDTDSVIYISREGEWDVPIGSFLGEMTDELEKFGRDSYITEFVSGGPKNYAFKAWSTDKQDYITICKVKGICLNYTTGRKVNFDSMKEMILEQQGSSIPVTSRQIRRTNHHDVISKQETKIYRAKAEKRKFKEDFNSFPYGYKQPKIDNTLL